MYKIAMKILLKEILNLTSLALEKNSFTVQAILDCLNKQYKR